MKQENINKTMLAFLRVESRVGVIVPEGELRKELKGMTKKDFNHNLKRLKSICAVFEPRKGFFRRF